MGMTEIRDAIVNGKTALGIEFGSTRIKAVLVGAEEYQRTQETLAFLKLLALGDDDIRTGRTRPDMALVERGDLGNTEPLSQRDHRGIRGPRRQIVVPEGRVVPSGRNLRQKEGEPSPRRPRPPAPPRAGTSPPPGWR